MRKLVCKFTASHHRKMSTMSLFNIRQGLSKLSRDYLVHFNEATNKLFLQTRKCLQGNSKIDSRWDTLMNPSPKIQH